VEFAPEAGRQAGNKAVNSGESGVSEITKRLIDISLAFLLKNCMVLPV
jgi:hypothetical protein